MSKDQNYLERSQRRSRCNSYGYAINIYICIYIYKIHNIYIYMYILMYIYIHIYVSSCFSSTLCNNLRSSSFSFPIHLGANPPSFPIRFQPHLPVFVIDLESIQHMSEFPQKNPTFSGVHPIHPPFFPDVPKKNGSYPPDFPLNSIEKKSHLFLQSSSCRRSLSMAPRLGV